jgi:hypothetical protein
VDESLPEVGASLVPASVAARDVTGVEASVATLALASTAVGVQAEIAAAARVWIQAAVAAELDALQAAGEPAVEQGGPEVEVVVVAAAVEMVGSPAARAGPEAGEAGSPVARVWFGVDLGDSPVEQDA